MKRHPLLIAIAVAIVVGTVINTRPLVVTAADEDNAARDGSLLFTADPSSYAAARRLSSALFISTIAAIAAYTLAKT